MEKWEARLVYSPDQLGHKLYLIQKGYQTNTFMVGNNKTFTVKRGEVAKTDPYLVILDPSQQQAIAKALSDEGVQTEPENLLKGKLQATENHLQDMRKLVFRKRKE